ncbi:ATP-binding protein [uncultured Litoreibacter sp.]|uniref:ATP-binding protein n=1 Tax=uncultured Litoreibacter sp. TaxID=1392394 RepID=UPI002614B9E5|nr:ATP-binding protein [uncultured Litoreibacter sp.]
MGFLSNLFNSEPQMDDRLEELIGPLKSLLVCSALELPEYRYLDLYHAAAARAGDHAKVIESELMEELTQLLHTGRNQWTVRAIGKANRVPFANGPGSEEFLPNGCFWVYRSGDNSSAFVIRLLRNRVTGKAHLEAAAPSPELAEGIINDIVEASSRNSVYRGKILHLSYSSERRDEYGDVEKQEMLRVLFSPITPVGSADIVLSEQHRALLKRNVIDLATRRELLKANGVPPKRGVLLHGPPGTGKTYACRHLCNEMPEVTHIFVTGSSLANVGAVFSLARLFQPSVVFVEDADLMFNNRDVNMNTGILGELMDQMDGLRVHEAISVVMTTNAIDRMEDALKDRPGRISQCIYMGAPDADLRARFIRHQLRDYDSGHLDIGTLSAETDGASQAFIKEWVFRAVQIGCERLSGENGTVALQQTDFSEALSEMRLSEDRSAGKIIGF